MAEAERDSLAALVGASLGETLRELTLVRGGGNNRIYRGELAGGPVAVKAYHPAADGSHLQRLERETRSLAWLRACGITAVPGVRGLSAAHAFAVYDWVEGEKLPVPIPEAESAATVGAINRFLDALHAAGPAPADGRWLAQEACLSSAELLRQIDARIERLQAIDDAALKPFLAQELAPVLERARQRAQSAAGLPWDQAIPDAIRDFSPSDFGYHNALRAPQGGLVFVDFEYAGWDDAAKLTSDFLWHPGMALSPQERAAFLEAALRRYGDVTDFAVRLAVQHPLYGLRWCLILLNEFLPERWQKRLFAAGGRLAESDWQAAKMRQLDRARAYLRAASRMVDTPARLDPRAQDSESWMPAWEAMPSRA
ncbi:MAG TPA: aminoglycoside phosphotransferase family protein [Hypericibacter adhaerens]|uniref:aminoglycoside phosphotransferase family protein n=1 Tax=Hypericibacter adhaerens TaxID=2602016 RepID=UPI002C27C6E5|nr:aminoglycoside phosphotransferase family protein [Hypericibacter adhaerens]HWA44560.1 aminoglycoside phosphotransferase family protein [Hypericibacter adhaerens]